MNSERSNAGAGAAGTALVVDDDDSIRATMTRVLKAWKYNVDAVPSEREAVELLRRQPYDVIFLDVFFDGDWRGVIDVSSQLEAPPMVIMMSGQGDVSTAVEAMRRGATDFLQKPLNIEQVLTRIDQNFRDSTFRRKLKSHRKESVQISSSETPAMRDALALADRVAATPSSSALIIGESGVGKEVLAERIHERSARHAGPFMCVNLAAIPEHVIEAELFGSTRGAFTDAKRDRAGYLATADGGTLLLDEIGEFRIEYQAKLLRVLEERRFFPVGSDKERRVDVRILAATNRSPEEMLEKKLLRTDLYYRLGTVIRIPPLRERVSEIIPLAREFIQLYCAEFGRSPYNLTNGASTALTQYKWPGNIRELRNVIERAVMMCDDNEISSNLIRVGLSQRESAMPTGPTSESLRLEEAREAAIGRFEAEHIANVLKIAGSRSRAAELLNVSRSTLYEKLKRYGLD